MMKRILFLLPTIMVVFFISGCSEEGSAPAPASKKKKVEKIEVSMPKTGNLTGGSAVIKEEAAPVYSYDPAGRRDPFEVLVELRKPVIVVDEPLTPLQQVDLGQLRLIGLIVGKGVPMAMVSAPGGKSYILKKGVKVGRNNGVVIGVDPEGVSVQEKYYDFAGDVRESVQKIELPKREGAN
jgi:type IV pilus assembly protein PilP